MTMRGRTSDPGGAGWLSLAIALLLIGVSVPVFPGCGEDINQGAFNPNGPSGAIREREPNNTPDLAQVLDLELAKELVVSGSYSGVGITSGELDFYKLATPSSGGPFTLTIALQRKTSNQTLVALYGNGVTNIQEFAADQDPASLTQEVESGLTFDLMLLALTGAAGDYELRIQIE